MYKYLHLPAVTNSPQQRNVESSRFFQLCPNSSKVGYKRPVGVSANPNFPYPKKLGHINSLCCPTLLGHGAMYTKGESSKNQFGWLYQEVMGSKLYPCSRSVLELQPLSVSRSGPQSHFLETQTLLWHQCNLPSDLKIVPGVWQWGFTFSKVFCEVEDTHLT